MPTYAPCHVLLIDDDPAMMDIIQTLLENSKPVTDSSADLFQIEQVSTLSAGIAALDHPLTHQSDRIVLLDLNLPDSQGVQTLTQTSHIHPGIPIIVLTGMDDEVVAVKAIEAGARGFLNKDNLDANLLAYALLLAAEQRRQIQGVSSASPQRQTNNPNNETEERREIENFERLAYSVRPVTIASNLFGSGLLKDAVPDIFGQMIETYMQILDEVLEQRTFRVEHPISARLRALAEQLGFLKAGARDLVELHTLALKKKGETENSVKAKIYAAEGRLIVLELMGYLTTYYRKYYIGLSKLHATRTGRNDS